MMSEAFNGVWVIENASSSWSDGNFPPDMSLKLWLTFQDGRLVYHSENDTDKSQPVRTLDYDTPLTGEVSPLQGSTRFDSVRVRQISEREFEILEMLGEDVIVAAYWRFSDDAKNLWRWGVGKSPEGRSRSYEELFIRQD